MPTIEALTARIERLEQRLDDALNQRLGRLEDIKAIERLQYAYGYYIDMLLYDEMVELFCDDGAMEIGQRGRYEGKENIRRFLYDVLGTGQPGLRRNQIINHTQFQGIVSVDDDGQTARARFRAIVQASGPAPVEGTQKEEPSGSLMWAEGVYENQYVLVDGIWKIALLWWSPTFYVTHPYERLWFDSTPQSESFPPQRQPYEKNTDLGRVFVPYHYAHPITGEAVLEKVVK